MDMKFKSFMSKPWELKDDRVIVGNYEYYFSEIKEVEHEPPQHPHNYKGIITIHVEGGFLGTGEVFFSYKRSESENGKTAAEYLIDKVKNTDYDPNLIKTKKRAQKEKASGKTTLTVAFIIAILSAVSGFNISYDDFGGRILTGTYFAVAGFLGFLIAFALLAAIIGSIFPAKASNFLKGVLIIASVGCVSFCAISTIGSGGYKPNNDTTERRKCEWCEKWVDAEDMRGNWCKDCQNNAFGEGGWYNN